MKTLRSLLILLFVAKASLAQILTSSPYSRYGLGEINSSTFASSAALGGSFIAYHQDSIAPFFVNVANPAGLAGLRLSTFELGGQAQFTKISSNSLSVEKRNVNFSYATVAFPLKRFGGAAFGIMPYSTVGYKISSPKDEPSINGTVNYIFQGEGGINKVFLATGIKPFRSKEFRFYQSDLADTLKYYNQVAKYKRIKFAKQLLSELSIGASGNYLFGTINQNTDLVYPGSITYFNVKRQRITQVSDFTANGGLQTHFTIDSVKYHGKDTLKQGKRVALKERVKVGFGFYVNAPFNIGAKQSTIIYNYAIDGSGVERAKDTVLNSQENPGRIVLPMEMGFGMSVKKGERLTVLMDASTTNWSDFKYFDTPNTTTKNSYRVSAGINYVPRKIAFGSANYLKRVQYRLGFTYSDGYLDLKNTSITNYAVTAGLGLPVGIGRFDDVSVVNISAQYGKMGTVNNNLLQEDYFRLVVGFTFNKRWFVKYKYD